MPKQIRLIANLRQKSVQKSDKNSVSSAQNIGSTQVFQTPETGQTLPYSELSSGKSAKIGKRHKKQQKFEETLDTSQLLKKKDDRNL